MNRWDPLNDGQFALLQQVANGDDLSDPSRIQRRTSARALATRGLLVVSRADGRWSASLTDAGRFYLAHGHHPDRPKACPKPRPPKQAPGCAKAAAALVERLLADGVAAFAPPTPAKKAELSRAIAYAKQHGMVPPGHMIRREHWDRTRLIVVLHGPATSADRSADVAEIPLPTTVKRLAPAVAALRADTTRLSMPPRPRRRALLILGALAAEAVRLGYTVRPWDVEATRGLRRPASTGRRDGAIAIVVDDHEHPVVIRQEAPRSLAREAAERLTIDLGRCRGGRQARWADRKRRPLERLLPDVLEEIAVRAEHDRERRSQELQLTEARTARWQEAVQEATRLARARHHAKLLRSQAAAFAEFEALQRYATALRRRLTECALEPGPDSAWSWLRWVEDHLHDFDPLRSPPSAWDAYVPAPEDLAPFLEGWSPYGPGTTA